MPKKPRFEDLPYRPCAGLCVINRQGHVFIGRRLDEDEKPYPAALRELHEETNIKSVKKLGEIKEWLTYDIPPQIAGKSWSGKYRGQKQKWFALLFTGDDSEIDIETPAGSHKPEFGEWRWVPMQELPGLVVPFKRKSYERVVKEFSKFAAPLKKR
jgi:putative (di)nucleoside polyphosphate hydrolase